MCDVETCIRSNYLQCFLASTGGSILFSDCDTLTILTVDFICSMVFSIQSQRDLKWYHYEYKECICFHWLFEANKVLYTRPWALLGLRLGLGLGLEF